MVNLKGSQEETKMVDLESLSGKEGGLAPSLRLRQTSSSSIAEEVIDLVEWSSVGERIE